MKPARRSSAARDAAPNPAAPRGFVLLTVLIVIMLASMLAVSLLFSVRVDATAQATGEQQEQAWATAMSGVARALEVARTSVRGQPAWFDNAAAFQHQLVTDDGADRWYFSVYSTSDSLQGELRFGLTDEAGKLSLSHAQPDWIARLPRLDADLARLLAPRSAPAPTPTIVSTTPPTAGTVIEPIPSARDATSTANPATPNDPSPSLDERFARAGLGPALLYGEDANFNLRLDANEDDAEDTPPLDDRNGLLDAGLQQFLTVDTCDLNVDADGRPRANLNDPRADLAAAGLPQSVQDFVAARLRAGKAFAHPVELLDAEESLPDATGKNVPMKSGLGRDGLATVLDHCTTTADRRLPGRVNLLTAPAAVLAALPGLGESGADAVVAARPGLSAEERRTPAWLLQRSLVTADQFKELAPHLTTRGYQFSFHCLGYAVPSGRYRVLAAVIDVAEDPPRILALRDLTRFGFPLPLEQLETAGP